MGKNNVPVKKIVSPEMINALGIAGLHYSELQIESFLDKKKMSCAVGLVDSFGASMVPAPPRSMNLKEIEQVLRLDLRSSYKHPFFMEEIGSDSVFVILQETESIKFGTPVNAIVSVWFLGILKKFNFLPTGDMFMQTTSADSDGDHVCVGCVNHGSISIPYQWYKAFEKDVINMRMRIF